MNPVTLVRPLGRGQRQNLRCPSPHQHLTLPRSWQLQQQQGLVTVTPLSLLLVKPTTTEVVRPGVKLRGIDRLGTRLPPGEPDNQVQIWSPVTAFLLGALVTPLVCQSYDRCFQLRVIDLSATRWRWRGTFTCSSDSPEKNRRTDNASQTTFPALSGRKKQECTDVTGMHLRWNQVGDYLLRWVTTRVTTCSPPP